MFNSFINGRRSTGCFNGFIRSDKKLSDSHISNFLARKEVSGLHYKPSQALSLSKIVDAGELLVLYGDAAGAGFAIGIEKQSGAMVFQKKLVDFTECRAAIYQDGFVYIAGSGLISSTLACIVAKLDSAGKVLWLSRLSGFSASAISLDAAADLIYLSGVNSNGIGNQINKTIKASDGSAVTLTATQYTNSFATSVSDYLFNISGRTTKVLHNVPTSTNDSYFVSATNTYGIVPGAGSSTIFNSGAEINGVIYLAGTLRPLSQGNIGYIHRYSTPSKRFRVTINSNMTLFGVDAGGNLYAFSSSPAIYVFKLDKDLNLIFAKSIVGPGLSISSACLSSDRLYIVARNTNILTIVSFDLDGRTVRSNPALVLSDVTASIATSNDDILASSSGSFSTSNKTSTFTALSANVSDAVFVLKQ